VPRERASTDDAASQRSSDVPTTRAPGPPAALRVLRERTATSHAALDLGLSGHERSVGDEASYLRLVQVLATLHADVEVPLHTWVAATPWVSAALDGAELPARTALYADDLARLGAVAPAPRTAEPYDDARGLAVLYLLAGSAKGARMLLKGLPDHVAPAARSGLRDAASRESARLWGAVVTTLGAPLAQAHPATHLDLAAAAAEQAADVFGALHGLVDDERRAS
jgi:heme oxygenase